jgi:hypothetical protein
MELEAIRLELNPYAVPYILKGIAIHSQRHVIAVLVGRAINGNEAGALVDADRFKHARTAGNCSHACEQATSRERTRLVEAAAGKRACNGFRMASSQPRPMLSDAAMRYPTQENKVMHPHKRAPNTDMTTRAYYCP